MPTDAVLACTTELAQALADGPVLATDVSKRFNTKYGHTIATHARRRLAVQVIRVDGQAYYAMGDDDDEAA